MQILQQTIRTMLIESSYSEPLPIWMLNIVEDFKDFFYKIFVTLGLDQIYMLYLILMILLLTILWKRKQKLNSHQF